MPTWADALEQLGIRGRARWAESVYLATGRDTTRPVNVRVHLTDRCNYRCASCDHWRRDHYPAELTLPQWQQILLDIQSFSGRVAVQFLGGEPTLWPEFERLVSWCGQQQMPWGLCTNGSTLLHLAPALAAARPMNIDVSLDGASSPVHDLSRGVRGSRAQIWRGLRALKSAADLHQRAMAIRLKVTVHRGNLAELADLAHQAQSLGGVAVDYAPVRAWTPEVESRLWLRPDDMPRLHQAIEALCRLRQEGLPIATEPARMRAWPAHFRRDPQVPALAPCRAGIRDMLVGPDGQVRMCWFYPAVGGLAAQTVAEVWQGEVARTQRQATLQCERFGTPACATSCLSHRPARHDLARAVWWLRDSASA